MKYRDVCKIDLIIENPDKKWWQFWKPYYINKEFEIEVIIERK